MSKVRVHRKSSSLLLVYCPVEVVKGDFVYKSLWKVLFRHRFQWRATFTPNSFRGFVVAVCAGCRRNKARPSITTTWETIGNEHPVDIVAIMIAAEL